MKNLILILPAHAHQRLADFLRGLDRVTGFTFTHAEGHGTHAQNDAGSSARDLVVGYAPHLRVDLLLDDADVEPVLTALRTADLGVKGSGVWWVMSAEQQGRF